MRDTSLANSQKDATDNNAVTDDDDNDRQQERHPQVVNYDDQRELPIDACRPLISGHADTSECDRAALPPARLETNKRERRYSGDRYDTGKQSRVIVQPTWLETFPQEGCPANYSHANGRQEEHVIQDIDQHPLCINRQTAVVNTNDDQHHSQQDASCNDPPARSISEDKGTNGTLSTEFASPFLLFPSSSATRSPDEMHSSREMTRPPRDIVTTAGCSETTATISTSDGCAKETYGNLHTGSDIVTTENSKVLTGSNSNNQKPHHANTLSPLAVDRKSVEKEEGNEAFASVSPSSATKEKCSKNKDNNVRYKKERSDGQQHNCQPTKTLPRKRRSEQNAYRQHDSMI